jgi:hypothetical protein
MSSKTNIIIVLVAIGWVVFNIAWHWFRSKLLLQQWAKANGFELVKMSVPWFTISPFLASKRQGVYWITARDHSGREHIGYAKCGGFWLGFLVDKVEVEWDILPKPKHSKQTNAEPQTIKVRVAKIVNFICKWLVIGAVTVFCLLIYCHEKWARWHH